MICKYCKKEMELDDTDFNFKGCYDNYWLCSCGVDCVQTVRYNETYYLDWFKDGNLIDHERFNHKWIDKKRNKNENKR